MAVLRDIDYAQLRIEETSSQSFDLLWNREPGLTDVA